MLTTSIGIPRPPLSADWVLRLYTSKVLRSVLPLSPPLPLSMPPDHMSLWTTIITSTAGPIAALVDAYRIGIKNITVNQGRGDCSDSCLPGTGCLHARMLPKP